MATGGTRNGFFVQYLADRIFAKVSWVKKRGELFYEYVRIVDLKIPEAAFENIQLAPQNLRKASCFYVLIKTASILMMTIFAIVAWIKFKKVSVVMKQFFFDMKLFFAFL